MAKQNNQEHYFWEQLRIQSFLSVIVRKSTTKTDHSSLNVFLR